MKQIVLIAQMIVQLSAMKYVDGDDHGLNTFKMAHSILGVLLVMFRGFT